MEKRRRKWTEGETQFLLENYHLLGPQACAQRLKRSYAAILNKASKLRLPKKRLERGVKIEQRIAALKTRLTTLQRKYNELLRLSDLQDRILEILRQRVEAFQPVQAPQLQQPRLSTSEAVAILLLSDLHVGEVVSADETMGLAEYDFEIFMKRLQLLSDEIYRVLLERMHGYSFTELVIFFLGDIVAGTIHEELVETSQFSVVEQVLYGAYVLAQFLREQAGRFQQVQVFAVSGNHGRLTREKRFKRRFADWDRVAYEVIALLLKGQSNLSFKFSNAPFLLVEIYGSKFLIEHGDGIRRWMGFPWYGVERERIRKRELLENIASYADNGALENTWRQRARSVGSFQYMCLGHFHQAGQIDTPSGEVFINGSFIGGSEYSIGKFGLAMRPTQLLLGASQHGVISFRFLLRLDKALPDTLRYKKPQACELVNMEAIA